MNLSRRNRKMGQMAGTVPRLMLCPLVIAHNPAVAGKLTVIAHPVTAGNLAIVHSPVTAGNLAMAHIRATAHTRVT